MLWCAFHKVKISPGYFFCEHVLHIATKSVGDIVMGGLITVIAKHFGFDPKEHPLPALSETLYFDATHLSKTGFSLPPSDTAQPEAQSAPAGQQHSAEPAPPTQSAQDTPAESAQPTLSAVGPSSSTAPPPFNTKALFTYLERLSDDVYFVDRKLESGLDTFKDRHDQLFDLVMEIKDKQKELKEMMKQLMAFLGMPPPPPSPPPKPPL